MREDLKVAITLRQTSHENLSIGQIHAMDLINRRDDLCGQNHLQLQRVVICEQNFS